MKTERMPHKPRRAGFHPRTARRLLGYVFRPYKVQMAVVLVCILVSALAGVAGSMFLQPLIDNFITPLTRSETPDFGPLAQALCVMAGIYLLGVVCTWLYNRAMVTIGQGVLRDIRDEMFAKMQALPVGYFDTHAFGDVMSRYTNDTDTLRQMINQSLPTLISSSVTVVGVLCALIYTSPLLTVLVLAMVALMFLVTRFIGGRSGYFFTRQQKDLGLVNGYIEEMMDGQKVVKVFCHEEKAMEQFDRLNDELCASAAGANAFANMMMPIMANLGNLMYVLAALAGGALALGAGGLTLGALASFLQLTRSFSMPISQIAQQTNSVVMALAGAERIFAMMDEQPETDGGEVTLVSVEQKDGRLVETSAHSLHWAWKVPEGGSFRYVPLEGDVRMESVDFSYQPGKQILHGINLYAHPGDKVAFVGHTGAGKTTITNLLNRFYDIDAGRITYDGIDIARIKKPDLRRALGMVLQDTHLFTGTVLENIRYGRLDATDEECVAAAKLANADRFIRRLPQGYQTVLTGDGAGLSQGQRQLLNIARAAVADPPVMVLDEATSSIDTRTESLVQQGMDALMTGRTVFVIAHRLSTIQNSDVIMVMDAGRIVERGNHEALMEKKGRYYQLYTGVFELE